MKPNALTAIIDSIAKLGVRFTGGGVSAPAMPPLDMPRHVGKTGYHVLTGTHVLDGKDLARFLDFADGVFNKQ